VIEVLKGFYFLLQSRSRERYPDSSLGLRDFSSLPFLTVPCRGFVFPTAVSFIWRLTAPSDLGQAILALARRDYSEDGKLPARKRFVDPYGTRLPSRRQLRVIELVAQGLKNKEIAKELGIGQQVVRNNLGKIYDKIGVSNRVELALWYWTRRQEGKPLRTGQ
jgi:DNA-binding CsgD family transcriptional regulator